jgi:hypothetical protein
LYIPALKIFQKRFRRLGPDRNVAVSSAAQFATTQKSENTRSNRKTRTVLHPPYIPDLAPSDAHLSATLQDAIRVKTFGGDDEVTEDVAAGTKFRLAQEGDRCSCLSLVRDLEVHENYVVK